MPQDSAALNNLTVGEALYYTVHLRGLSRADARRERDALLDLWNIGNLRARYSSRLSGGQRRLLRLAVASAGRLPAPVARGSGGSATRLAATQVRSEMIRFNTNNTS